MVGKNFKLYKIIIDLQLQCIIININIHINILIVKNLETWAEVGKYVSEG